MFSKIREVIVNHIKSNINLYFFLFLAFVAGISAGAFTVNGLSPVQKKELNNYLHGFFQLFENQKVDGNEILRLSLIENMRQIAILWGLGVTIIGIPFIYILIGVRGFITGFTSGFIIEYLGLRGVLFSAITILPKELIIIPCLIALGVNGINFSLSIIKNKSNKDEKKNSLKINFFAYCFVTLTFSTVIFLGIFVESYIIPVFIRMTFT
ncbi:stage II sporulation protein M [Acetivibrio saccincola]|uniref:Stage II sporulation protein M n=1 Tax=Acetivibrio saccincola TaxID=1677857 RepID=A0A2K9EF39_9FIRM|nr:stage II sporulation protein M [Acetivibrio saccincola]AUG57835.1 Stage II sporulation protein M [Acetivibrio saccincola]NLW26769.1 stage II sporulation protein M [Acetivibrio saccincola]PQQ67718.1 stage II sporulation protein M [Acetivibrio saccincola]HOA98216.1 stage II sporulation protein M [Acetivibrio saccincola]HQD29328.1 stage II sporulation protein M [Acetivibrio saccincola]